MGQVVAGHLRGEAPLPQTLAAPPLSPPPLGSRPLPSPLRLLPWQPLAPPPMAAPCPPHCATSLAAPPLPKQPLLPRQPHLPGRSSTGASPCTTLPGVRLPAAGHRRRKEVRRGGRLRGRRSSSTSFSKGNEDPTLVVCCSRCGSDFVLVDRFLSRIVRGCFCVVRGRIWGSDLLEKVGSRC